MIHPSKTRVGFGTILGLAVLAILAIGPRSLAGSTVPAEKPVPTAAAVLEFDFDALPPLPGGEGFAGAIAGLDGRHLIVAGGANFAHPDAPRWETPKAWHDDVHVLDLAEQEWKRPPGYQPGAADASPVGAAYAVRGGTHACRR